MGLGEFVWILMVLDGFSQTACGALWEPVATCGGLWQPVADCCDPLNKIVLEI